MCRVQNSLSRSLKSTLAKHRLLELHQLLLPNTIQKYFIKYDPEIKIVQNTLYLNSIPKSDETAKNSISQGKVNNHYSYYTNSLSAVVVVQTSATQSDIWFDNSPRDGNNRSFQYIYTDQLPFLQYFHQILMFATPQVQYTLATSTTTMRQNTCMTASKRHTSYLGAPHQKEEYLKQI